MVSSVGTVSTDASGNQYRVVLSDDFSAGYNYSKWGSPYHGGSYGNGAFWWNANDVKVASGEMQVSATRHSNGSWSAGGFNSKAANLTIKYGTVEFDVRVEKAQGTQAAILMWPKSDAWPRDGEIDILETPKGGSMHTVHWAGANNQDTYSAKLSGIDSSQTHHYKMTWLPNLLTIAVDGKVVASWTNPDIIPDTAMGFGAMSYVANNSEAWLGGGPNGSTPGKVTTHIDNVVMSQWTGTVPGGNTGGSTGGPIAPAPGTPVIKTIGTGSDTLVLKISEDAYNGHAQYTISVDGKQVGGTQTAGASHAAGQDDIITVKGDWGAGTHKVTVNFLNDAYGGSPSLDRNLHVDGITFNGTALARGTADLGTNGPVDFGFTKAAPPAPTPSPSPGTPTTGLVKTIGAGSDAIVMKVSQDAYNGSAQYIVSVDGKQIGGTQTASASHAAKASDVITIKGDWSAGGHVLTVKFINDASGSGGDRNLYIDDLSYKGATFSRDTAAFKINGPNDFHFREAAEGFGATYLGTSARDSFAIDRGEGHVVIDGFTSGADKLAFKGFSQSAMHTAATSENGVSGLLISFDGTSDNVFLAHVGKIAAGDMLFA
ncbi:carbohydrate-binding domain-containing protein [Belnapia moabensis]|uniref:carbohydrate-binding domain-containing protein n=1 Tax=Belnapia moabensis TaxID=365533 RepID=UPI000693E936|nr:carbohydrate-binding domain-containing protein [Belnapia moabensis]